MFRAVAIAGTAALAASTLAPAIHADPDDPDPHIPNIQANYCPGGGTAAVFFMTFCDGVPYADGSYWHFVRTASPSYGDTYSSPTTSRMRCVVNPDGGPLPQPAPPGGCDGAVQ